MYWLTYFLLSILAVPVFTELTVEEEHFVRSFQYHATADTRYQQELILRSRMQCAAFCNRNDSCVSFSFNKTTRTCTLGTRVLLETSDKVYDKSSRIARCPTERGYIFYIEDNLCLKHISAEEKFTTANESCVSIEGGHLLVIDSVQVHRAIIDIMRAIGSDDLWISGYDAYNNGTYVRWNGLLLSYVPLKNVPGNEPCLFINISQHDMHVEKRVCDDTNQYICQVDM